eukprot:1146292-Pelagomonas_calceolata.AAC.1
MWKLAKKGIESVFGSWAKLTQHKAITTEKITKTCLLRAGVCSRKGKGYRAAPAYEGSLAEASKKMPATKPDLSLKLKRKA